MSHNWSWTERRRHGLAMVAVLICLLVVAILASSMLRALVQQHSQLRSSHRNLQAFWLAESALQRAAYQLNQEPDYEGEKWIVPAELLGAEGCATVQVQAVTEPVTGQQIQVTAVYPNAELQRSLSQRQLVIQPVASLEEQDSTAAESSEP